MDGGERSKWRAREVEGGGGRKREEEGSTRKLPSRILLGVEGVEEKRMSILRFDPTSLEGLIENRVGLHLKEEDKEWGRRKGRDEEGERRRRKGQLKRGRKEKRKEEEEEEGNLR